MPADGIAQRICQPTRHPCDYIRARRAKNNNYPSSHILAGVLARAFDHGKSPTVAHSKSFAHTPGDIQFAAGCAIKDGVARDYVAPARGLLTCTNRNRAPAQALAQVIVGFSSEMEIQPGNQKCAEALAGAAEKFVASRGM